jgi:hypothetical protein
MTPLGPQARTHARSPFPAARLLRNPSEFGKFSISAATRLPSKGSTPSDKGLVVIAGRTLNNDKTTFGMVTFRADSDAAAREIMSRDPGIQKGLFKSTRFPFLITAQQSH